MSIKRIFDRVNVLYVSPFGHLGGGEVSLLTLLSGLDRQACNPHVVCYEEGLFPDRVRELLIPCMIVPRRSLPDELRIMLKLIRYIRAQRIHVVHVNSLDIRAALAARFAGAALVTHLRVVMPFSRRDRFAAGISQVVIAVSGVVRDAFCRGSNRLRERFAVIPNAVAVPAGGPAISLRAHLNLPADARIAGMSGRLDPLKGHDCFLQAAVLIKRRIPGAYFVIAGDGQDGEYESGIRSDIERLGLAGSVFLLGFRRDILSIIAQFDVLAVPSLQFKESGKVTSEGFGRVAIEGMAMGVPVVVSDSGGLKELVDDGVNGRIVPQGDYAALAGALADILSDSDSAQALIAAGHRTYLRRYTVENHVAHVERVYASALLRSRRGAGPFIKSVLLTLYFALRSPFLRLLDKAMPSPRPESGSGIPAGSAAARILVIRPDRLGDFVLTLPLIENLRAAYPRGSIDVCIREELKGLAEMIGYIDRVVPFGALRQTCARVRVGRYDVVIDMLNDYSLASAIVARSSGAPVRIGFSGGRREVFFTHPVSGSGARELDMAAINLELLEPLGVDPVNTKPVISLRGGLAPSGGKYVVIHPGAHYPSQRWPAEKFGRLAGRIAGELGMAVFVVAGPGETELALQAARAGGNPAVRTAKPSLRELVGILAGAALVVCNNSGPLHLASALGVPTLSTMGPTDPLMWFPRGEFDVVVRKDAACSPCSRGECGRHRCLEAITVDEMFNEASRLLGNERVEAAA